MTTTPTTPLRPETPLNTIDVPEETAKLVHFAAAAFGVDEATVVARAIACYERQGKEHDCCAPQASEMIPIQGSYQGNLVRALFFPTTGALKIIDGPLAGQQFTAPSTAATAVVALNPRRLDPTTNGWDFWRLVLTGERLCALRR